MIHIKTQNIATDFLTVPKEKIIPTEQSVESFRNALKSVTEEEVKVEPELTIEAETSSTEEEDETLENIPWFMVSPLFTPENPEVKGTISFEHPEEIVDSSVNELTPIVSKEVDESVKASVIREPNLVDGLFKSVEAESNLSQGHEMETTERKMMDVDLEELNPNVSEKVVPSGIESIFEHTKQQQEMILPTFQKMAVNQIGNPESLQLDMYLEDGFNPLQPTMETMVIVEEKELSLPSDLETSNQSEVAIKPEVMNIEQLNQVRPTETQPQTEGVKQIPQEQWFQEVEHFIVENHSADAFEKVSTTRIQLTPKHLGEMEIELVIKDKELTARLVVEKMETKQWLEQKLAQLTSNLAAQDIKVEDIQIVVTNNESNFLDSSFEDNPFFKQQKQSFKQKKSFQKEQQKEQTTERIENKSRPGAGRLSMWV